ncbi:MAG: PaaX family transcriptional regulator C-terminal domain-containing protein [Planctomycetota bacterium]
MRDGAAELDFHAALWLLERRSDLGPVIELLRGLYGIVEDWHARRLLRNLEKKEKVEIRKTGRRNSYRAASPFVLDDVVAVKRERQAAGWDGRWCLLTYDLPRSAGPLRKRLIRSMRRVGMGRLNESTWASPYDWSEWVRAEVSGDGGVGHVDWIRDAEVDFHRPLDGAIGHMWPLGDVAARYRNLQSRAAALAGSSLNAARRGEALRLVQEWARVEAADPMLPRELLPGDWPAEDVRDSLQALRRAVSQSLAAGV